MSDDLVFRLRNWLCPECKALHQEAADRIEMVGCGRDKWEINASQLEEVCVQRYDRIKELEAALREIAADAEHENRMLLSVGHSCGEGYLDIKGKARRALEDK